MFSLTFYFSIFFHLLIDFNIGFWNKKFKQHALVSSMESKSIQASHCAPLFHQFQGNLNGWSSCQLASSRALAFVAHPQNVMGSSFQNECPLLKMATMHFINKTPQLHGVTHVSGSIPLNLAHP
jgi:hypothetical protein